MIKNKRYFVILTSVNISNSAKKDFSIFSHSKFYPFIADPKFEIEIQFESKVRERKYLMKM